MHLNKCIRKCQARPLPSIGSATPQQIAMLPSLIADNLSTHKTKRVDEFLAEHANVHLHFNLPNQSLQPIKVHPCTCP